MKLKHSSNEIADSAVFYEETFCKNRDQVGWGL